MNEGKEKSLRLSINDENRDENKDKHEDKD